MICIITATHPEATPLINYYHLKKDLSYQSFDVFRSENMILGISGIGKIRSAITTAILLHSMEKKHEVLTANIGSCGSADQSLQQDFLLLPNKITDLESTRAFYPDMIVNHNIPEVSLGTAGKAVSSAKNIPAGIEIIDMEASGFFEAARQQLESDQAYALKIVSDYLDPSACTPEKLSGIITNHLPKIDEILQNQFFLLQQKNSEYPEINEKLFHTISKQLLLTSSQQKTLREKITKQVINNESPDCILERYTDIEVTTKQQQKDILEALYDDLSSS